MELTIQDYGALADVIAVIGLIISIMYMSYQIRLSSLATQLNSRIVISQQNYDFAQLMLCHPELSTLWRQGRYDAESLQGEDYWRFTMICQQAFWSFSAQYKLYSAGMLSEEDWRESESLIHWALRGKGIRYWWEQGGRAGANVHFAAYIDREINKNSVRSVRVTSASPSQQKVDGNTQPHHS